MEEQWKEIDGYDGDYDVSNLGRIRSNKYGKTRILKPALTDYLHVNLSKNSVTKPHRVHILVAHYFVPNPYNKPEVNHKNGIKTDCRAINLEWSTRRENVDHAIKYGLFDIRGGNNVNSVLDEEDVNNIRHLYKNSSLSQYDLARKFKVSRPTISSIIARDTWNHLPIIKKIKPKMSRREKMKRKLHPNRY